jgi:Holliday junction resolvase RusA-like endonuclease
MADRTWQFQVYGTPEAQGSKRAILPKHAKRPIVVEGGDDDSKARQASWRREVISAAQQGWAGPPMDGPLRLEVRFVFPRPASIRKSAYLKSTTPDVDKLCRALMDALKLARLADLRALEVLADRDGQISIGAVVRLTELTEGGSPS